MTVTLSVLDDADAERWNGYVADATSATPFHRYEAIDLLADVTDSTLHLLAGFVGEEPVGVFPVFESTRGPLRLVRSPPEAEVFTLGPLLLNLQKLKQRKTERRHRRFVEAALEWLDETVDPDYVDIRTTPGYPDARPFTWAGYDVSPSYTYVVDLGDDEEALAMRFSRDARTNVETVADSQTTIRGLADLLDLEPGDVRDHDPTSDDPAAAAVEWIVARVQERHAEQDKPYPITPAFARRLYERLPAGQVRPYVATLDGERVGGIVALSTADTTYRWQGGTTPDVALPVNDALDWYVMRDAMARGHDRYDLVGANDPRLCDYKAKFDPRPVPYYVASTETRRLRLTRSVYHLVSRAVSMG